MLITVFLSLGNAHWHKQHGYTDGDTFAFYVGGLRTALNFLPTCSVTTDNR